MIPLSKKLDEIVEMMGGDVLTDHEIDTFSDAIKTLEAYEKLSGEVTEIVEAELNQQIISSHCFRGFYDRNIKVVVVKFKI